MYWVRKKIIPNRAKKASEIAALDAVKRGLRNSSMSSIGDGARRSQTTNATPTTSATAKAARTGPSVQPRAGASIRPQISVVSAAKESVKPRRSSFGALASRLSGTSQRPATSAPATIGRFTRKIQAQLVCSISQPPATGPIAMPMPETPAQMPIAFARSCAGKRRHEDRERGRHDERATDAHQRAHHDQELGCGRRARSRVNRGRRRPGRSVSARLRPKRSPSEPAVSSTPANTSM